MMTARTSVSKAGAELVPLPRTTDALGSALRDVFAVPPMPDELAELLRRLDRKTARH